MDIDPSPYRIRVPPPPPPLLCAVPSCQGCPGPRFPCLGADEPSPSRGYLGMGKGSWGGAVMGVLEGAAWGGGRI